MDNLTLVPRATKELPVMAQVTHKTNKEQSLYWMAIQQLPTDPLQEVGRLCVDSRDGGGEKRERNGKRAEKRKEWERGRKETGLGEGLKGGRIGRGAEKKTRQKWERDEKRKGWKEKGMKRERDEKRRGWKEKGMKRERRGNKKLGDGSEQK